MASAGETILVFVNVSVYILRWSYLPGRGWQSSQTFWDIAPITTSTLTFQRSLWFCSLLILKDIYWIVMNKWFSSQTQVLSHLRQQRMLMVQTVAQVWLINIFQFCFSIFWDKFLASNICKYLPFVKLNICFSTSLCTRPWSTTSGRAGSSSWSDHISSDQIRSDQIRSDQILSDLISSDQIRSDQTLIKSLS